MNKDLHIVFISNDWEEYHRRFFTEALIKEFRTPTEWIIVNLPVSFSVHLFTKFKRKFLKIFHRKNRNQNLADNAVLFTPVIIFHYLLWSKFPFISSIDSYLINRQIKTFYKKFNEHRKILWLFIPEVIPLSKAIKYNKLIYDFYDNYSYNEDGTINPKRKKINENLIKKSDLVICTAPFLYEQAYAVNNNSYYVPNACKYDVLSNVTYRNKNEYIGYLGGIRDWLDFELIEYLLKEISDKEFLFIGKIYDSAKEKFNELLNKYKNLKHIGFTEQEQLIKTMSGFKIGLIPFRTNNFFDGMFPNKFFEYMSMGVPIVTSDLPALSDFKHLIGYSKTYEEYKENCLRFLNNDNSELSKIYKKIASENSWEDRCRYIKELTGKILK